MSEETDALRELAANRGCKLRSSRRRKPGGDHGRFGLLDAKTGREVFGFGSDGLTATAEEIRSFLRTGGASTWRTSLGKVERERPARPVRAAKKPEPRPEPESKAERKPDPQPTPKTKREPEPAPEPELAIREARPRDAEAVAAMIVALGYEVTVADVRRRLAVLKKAGQFALVAERGPTIGVITMSMMHVIHRPRPVGRISLLVVKEEERGGGIGTALVEAAAERLKAAGCGLLEVTSNMKRSRAHAFYERLGFERTSYRFARKLAD